MTSQYYNNFVDTTNFSDTGETFILVANTAQSYTVPGNNQFKYQVIFGFNASANLYVGLNVVPVIPADGGSASGRFVDFRPLKRFVQGGDVLNFITPDATLNFGISLRYIQQGI